MSEFSMFDVGLWGFVIRLVYFVIALIVLRGLLWWLDRSLGLRFADVLETIRENPLACSIYFGARLLAVGILGAAFL